MPWSPRPTSAALCSCLALGIASHAAAAPTPEDAKRADALFEEGTRLMDEGRYDRACPALQESLVIDPATGTALALARCFEKAGKLASAWSAYLDAEARAYASGQQEREDAARLQAASLAPRLPYIAITLGGDVATALGLVLELDGRAIAKGALGPPIPVDPGYHVVEVRADKKQPDRRVLRIAEAETRPIFFSSLADEAVAAAPSDSNGSADPSSDGGTLRMIGFGVGGAGLVGLGVGSVFGLLAAGASSDSDEACGPFEAGRGGTASQYDNCVTQRDDAGGLADVSTVAFIAGGILTAAGVGMIVFGGSEGDEVAVEIIPAPTSVTARGRF